MHAWKPLALTILPWLAIAAGAQEQSVPARKLVPPPAQAQEPTQQELAAKRDEKMALEVFKKAPWTFDFDQARAEAKKQHKLIFVYFSRSYAH